MHLPLHHTGAHKHHKVRTIQVLGTARSQAPYIHMPLDDIHSEQSTTLQKRDGYFNLDKVISVAAE